MSRLSRREFLEGTSAGLAIAGVLPTGRRIKSLPITRDKVLSSLA